MPGVHSIMLLHGQVRGGRIGEGGRERALAARFGEDSNDIRALSALADAEYQGVAQAGRLVVNREQAGGCQSDYQAVVGAEQVLGISTGVVAGNAAIGAA